jgi:hypothetical protein
MTYGFGGNNARPDIMDVIRRRLHDEHGEFWTDDDLIVHMQTSFTKVFDTIMRHNNEVGIFSADVTYTASSEKVDISTPTAGMRRFEKVEDRTDSQPGPLWTCIQNSEDKHVYNMVGAYGVVAGMPAYRIVQTMAPTASAFAMTTYIEASPPPTSNRSLRIYGQWTGPDFSVATGTSGMPMEGEQLAIIETCIVAKFQESDEIPQSWLNERKEAQMHMKQTIRSWKRGPKRIRYIPD